jgi:hypothetical protein
VAVVLVLLVLLLAVILEALEAMVLHHLSRGLLLPVLAVAVVAQKEAQALLVRQVLGALAQQMQVALAQMRLQIQDRAVAVGRVALLELAVMAVLASLLFVTLIHLLMPHPQQVHPHSPILVDTRFISGLILVQ